MVFCTDVKPANIMMDEKAKMIDFVGVASADS
jgi:hypothetical protein